MNDVVFENLLCDAAAQLREERLEKIKLPHKIGTYYVLLRYAYVQQYCL